MSCQTLCRSYHEKNAILEVSWDILSDQLWKRSDVEKLCRWFVFSQEPEALISYYYWGWRIIWITMKSWKIIYFQDKIYHFHNVTYFLKISPSIQVTICFWNEMLNVYWLVEKIYSLYPISFYGFITICSFK